MARGLQLHPSTGAVYDPVVITNYRADFTVDRDGRLAATEIITGKFPGDRHGIFRYWDIANQNDPQVRQVPQVTQILMDDRPIPYQMLWESGERFRVAKIGDPDSLLGYGTHVFRISYTIDGVLDPGSTGANKTFASTTGTQAAPSAFFWNVIAPAWNNQIDRADITITLPGGARRPVLGGHRSRPRLRRPDRRRRHRPGVGHRAGAPHAGDGAGRRRRPDASADRTALVLPLG